MSDALKAREAAAPFDAMTRELFARNYNRSDRVMSLLTIAKDGESTEVHLTFGDFLDLRAALSALDQPSGVRVGVKPLEWRDRHKTGNRYGDLIADSIVGQYVIRPSKDGFRLWVPGSDYNDAAMFAEVGEAKAAAQADHEARILSALDLSAIGAEGWKLVPVEPTEAMVAAAMNALDTPFYADLERAYAAMVEAAPSPPEPRS